MFCPGYDVAKAFAELVGLDKKARDYTKRKGKECRDRFHPPTEADEWRPWSCRPRIQHHRELVPYVAELIHGYYVVYLTDIDTQWHGDVGEEEVMWEATEVKGKKRGRE